MRKLTGIIGALAVIAVMTSCALGEPDTNGSAGPQPADEVGTLGVFAGPTTVQAGLGWGVFDDLPMTETVLDSGPAALPLVKRGDMVGIVDVSASPILVAETSGIPLRIVWMTSTTTYQLVVKPGLESAEDLVGKNIATVPGSVSEYVLDTYLTENGVDSASVNKVDLPPPSMPAAFSTDQIDGAFIWEPFSSQMIADGAVSIATDSDIGSVVISADYVEKHPDNVQALVCGLAESATRFLDDPQEAYEVISERIGQPVEAIAATMTVDSIVPPVQATPELLGDGKTPSESAKTIATVGEWLANLGRIPYAPSLEDIEALFDPSFAAAVTAGECDAN